MLLLRPTTDGRLFCGGSGHGKLANPAHQKAPEKSLGINDQSCPLLRLSYLRRLAGDCRPWGRGFEGCPHYVSATTSPCGPRPTGCTCPGMKGGMRLAQVKKRRSTGLRIDGFSFLC